MVNTYESCWALYQEAFPANQKRSMESSLEILTREEFSLVPFVMKNIFKGFLCHWDFDDFLYLEYFALSPESRGQGLGSRLLKSFIISQDKPVVIAVERPVNDFARRKVAFFEKTGFSLNPYEYIQPPVEEGLDLQRLFLMSYPVRLHLDDFTYVRDTLCREVYKAPIPV